MGVFTNWEGKEPHDRLICRQEAEIRLLETMKRCISNKIKYDREYAAGLCSVAVQGQKFDRWDDMKGSNVLHAWKVLMEELDNLGKLYKSNADVIEKEMLEKITNICCEKRKAKKRYQDEYSRLCQEFVNLSEEVSRKRSDYCKHLELYRLMRSRFEEHYIKCGRGGRKLEEVREKYQRACRKLHLVHNEYVLLITDARESQRDFNSVLLPCLLQQQRTLLQDFMTTWQNALKDLVKCWNVSSLKITEFFDNVWRAVNNIKPADEYKTSISEKQNGTVPAAASGNQEFTFDSSLVEDTTGRLQPDQLAVDNLTVEWVRSKMTDLESMLKECQADLSKETNYNSDLTTYELQSKERKLTKQIEVIKKALSDIGCEELPAGCDITSLENSLDQGNDTPHLSRVSLKRSSLTALSQTNSSTGNAASSGIVDILRKPFRRKSAPNSPILGSRSMGSSSDTGTTIGNQQSSGVTNPRSAIVNTESPSPPPLSPNNKHLSSSTDVLCSTNTSPLTTLGSSSRSLVDEEWFHGVLPREEVVRLLTKEGDFLVRETTRNDENQTVLSVCWGGHKHFIVQTTAEGEYRFEGPAFPTIQELISFLYKNGLPVTSRSGAILRQPILRERWELNNDDVYLIQKIGRGNFGDVYKAKLRSSNQEVAVKTCRVTVPEEHKKKFLQEGRILKQYDHPNVVKLIGICVQKQPIMIVMELVPGGSLLTFLRNNSAILTQIQMLFMCRDAAAGMRYLESKNCIHRDVAARNCLVGKDNVVKISDFGMSREEEEYIVSDGMKQIPIKWTAPEALNFGKYTSLCDVWSYGVLCWEIFSKGGTPYCGLSNSKAREKIDAGYRMPPPEGTPDEMYRLMLKCWEYKPENRPHFDQIHNILDALINTYA